MSSPTASSPGASSALEGSARTTVCGGVAGGGVAGGGVAGGGVEGVGVAGVGVEGVGAVLYIEDHQVTNEEVLETVNSLLSSGEVPGLFKHEELVPLLEPLNGSRLVYG